MRVLLAAILLFSGSVIFGQPDLLLKENFSDNHLGWYEVQDGEHSFKVVNGYYEMINAGGVWMTYIYPRLDETKDFSFEASFIQVDGDVANGYGFIWGYDEKKNLNHFIISTAGYLKTKSVNETGSDGVEWKKIDGVNPLGEPNHLKMIHQNGELKFLVNGNEVLSRKGFPWYGKTIGFISYTNMRLLIDDFEIYTDLDINLPPNLPSGLVKENLGPAINTEYDEVTPKISIDGSMIFFTRKNSPNNIGGETDHSDVWFSTTTDGVEWSKSQNLGRPLNTE
ncbi:MAG: hypothetical protein OEU76_04410, partial [Cyclobacteriaceae bacterium]|nr:hypothetical protein [Cyclobacteriaceae bacterium]